MNTKFKKGFTLIELLVVIAVIAIISSIVMAYVYDATSRGRDTRRKQNVDQLVKAINLFFSEKGNLPMNQTGWCTYISNTTGGSGAAFQADIQPYMKSIQLDPTNSGQVGDYLYDSLDNVGGHFVVCANMERASNGNAGGDYSSCVGGTTYNYCITQ